MVSAEQQKTADDLARALNEIHGAMDRKACLESQVYTYVIGPARSKLQVTRTAFSGKVEAYVVVEDGGGNTTYRPDRNVVDKEELKDWAEAQFEVVGVAPSVDALQADTRKRTPPGKPAEEMRKVTKLSDGADDNAGKVRPRTSRKHAAHTNEGKFDTELESIISTLDERIGNFGLLNDIATVQMIWWSEEYDRVKNANPGKNDKELSFLMRTSSMPSDDILLENARRPADRIRELKYELQAAAAAVTDAQAALCACKVEINEVLYGGSSSSV